MSLASGKKLGPYEIQSALGAGGMGEVYRARDTRLDRIVAVKILPAHLSANLEARQRFEREARAISSLSHPNICHLYDVGAADGVDYLVMEYLEGETLATRLVRGPLPMEQLVRVGIEIAEGLEQAHRSGVVHRDLKPGNIMLTKSGAKLMDFGLAKSAAAPAAGEPVSELTQALSSPRPTPTHPLTAQGTVVGTFQYMSPEQVEGREADSRSDIFALGALLFEMATGKRAFEGKSATSAMAAVLERDPPAVSALAPAAPPALDRIVKTCLEKEPDRRFQSAHDVGLQLRWLGDSPQATATSATPANAAAEKSRPFVAWAVACVGLLLAVIFASLYFSSLRPHPRLRAQIAAPDKFRFNFTGDAAGPVVLSPDGTHLVYSALVEGKNQLYVRSLDSLTPQPLPGTEDAIFPFWSPDGRSVAYFSNGKLRRLDISGGPPMELCDAPVGRGGSWGKNGVILFTPNFGAPLYRVPASGGTPVQVTKLAGKYSTNRWPWFLPDGEHFLYLAANHNAPESPDTAVFLGSLDGKEGRLLMLSPSNAIYASGYILFVRGTALMAQPFTASTQELKGEPQAITDNVQVDGGVWRSTFSASTNGTLIYEPGTGNSGTALTWLDRSGKQTALGGEREAFRSLEISPDGKKVALSIGLPRSMLWLYDLTRDVRTPFTFGTDQYDNLAWSPDGSQIAFTVTGGRGEAGASIRTKAASGAGEEKELYKSGDSSLSLLDWSPDGRCMIFRKGTPTTGTGIDLWILPLSGDRKPYPYFTEPGDQDYAQFSPDGKWIAYASRETTTFQVFVAPFPWTGAKWQVSTTGGVMPRWRRDGKELYFLKVGSGDVMMAQVDGHGASFEVGEVHAIFTLENMSPGTGSAQYAVNNNGQRFLVITTGDAAIQPLTLLENWTAELKK